MKKNTKAILLLVSLIVLIGGASLLYDTLPSDVTPPTLLPADTDTVQVPKKN